jgi:YVTN family beta-propeller protein
LAIEIGVGVRASLRVLLLLGAAVGLLLGVLAGSAVAAGSRLVLRDGLPPMVAPLAKSSGSSSSLAGGQARAAKQFAPVPVAGIGLAVGNLPTGVATNDTTAVVANSNDNTVSVVDLTASPVSVSSTVGVGKFPVGVAISPDGTTAYATNFKAGTLSVIDLTTVPATVSRTVNVGSDPDAVVQVGSSVYVSNLLSGSISVVDPSSGSVSAVNLTGTLTPAPSGLAASSDGHQLYVDDVRNGSTIVLDLTSSPATQDGTTTVGTYPAALAVDGSTGYVDNANLATATPGTVNVVDLSNPSSPSTTSTMSVGSHPYGISESPFLDEALVSNSGDGTMDVIDTSTNTVVGSPVPVGTTPDAVAITPDQTSVLVTDEGDNMVRILHVNQPPAIVVPGLQSVQANDSSGTHNQLTFSSADSNALSASDSDADGNPERVSLSVSSGTLTLASTSGLTFQNSTSNGSSSMTFTGVLPDINAALAGMTYEPNLDFVGPDTLTATIDDQGNTGDIGKPETTTNTVSINVLNGAPTASAPIFSGAIGNTVFGVGTSPTQPSATTSGNVLAGSTDPNGDTLTAVTSANPITTTDGGSVTMNSDGTFTYTPPVNTANTSDTFTFQITDGTNTSNGTATINIANAIVWYVDSALGTNGNGESNTPFNNLASVNSVSTDGDVIFLFGGASQKTYAGNLTLQPSEELIGQPAGLTVNSETLLPASGVNPIIKASSGTDVTIDNGTVIKNVDQGQTAAGVTGISGSNVTNFTSTGSADTADNGINLNGGTGTIHFFSTSTINSAGHSVVVANRTGGTVTFDGSVNDTGTGVSLTANSGTTTSFTGGLTVAVTGSSKALTATGGGTVAVTGSGNTLSSVSGDALDVENTGIGTSGLTFKSISTSGTGGSAPADPVLLLSTGTAGGLTVTGDGSTTVGGDGSGGTIAGESDSNVTAPNVPAEIQARSTGPISLSNMTIENSARNGVYAFDATAFTAINNTVTGNQGQGLYYRLGAEGETASADRTSGTLDIANNTMGGGTGGGAQIYVDGASSGSLVGNITGNTIGRSTNTTTSGGDAGMILYADGAADGVSADTVTLNVANNKIYGVSQQNGIDGGPAADGHGAPTMNLTMTGNMIDDEANTAIDAVQLFSADDSNTNQVATMCLNMGNTNSTPANANNFKATGLAANNSIAADASGAYLHNDYSATVFQVVGGPTESNPGSPGEDFATEAYIQSTNTLAGPPGDQQSFAYQFGNAGYTHTTSCPTAPAATLPPAAARTQRLSTRPITTAAGSRPQTRARANKALRLRLLRAGHRPHSVATGRRGRKPRPASLGRTMARYAGIRHTSKRR